MFYLCFKYSFLTWYNFYGYGSKGYVCNYVYGNVYCYGYGYGYGWKGYDFISKKLSKIRYVIKW